MINPFQGKTVLITGGTGSFGSNFVKHLLVVTKPKKLVIFSRDEFKQHYLAKELNDERTRFFLGDIRDLGRLQRAFQGIDIIIHAAALKQVPALEYNPLEAVKTNILGTQNIIEAAIDQQVKRVIFISTDKAVQPINLYGATKLCAEKLWISANAYSPKITKFSVVRYGNVVGSRGSIVEWLKQNHQTPVVHITDPKMTRFWMSLEKSFALITFAIKEMVGGEIFIPRIPSMRLVDIFKVLTPRAKQKIIGARPGEKIHEILFTEHEARRTFVIGDYFVIVPEHHTWNTGDPYQKYLKRGKAIEDNFIFSSETNKLWLSPEQLKKIVA
ncbi:MAG: UDP-N-acetylglucosamine 4,6-dehydratase (inverting) [Patescibacteria group bacterium]